MLFAEKGVRACCLGKACDDTALLALMFAACSGFCLGILHLLQCHPANNLNLCETQACEETLGANAPGLNIDLGVFNHLTCHRRGRHSRSTCDDRFARLRVCVLLGRSVAMLHSLTDSSHREDILRFCLKVI